MVLFDDRPDHDDDDDGGDDDDDGDDHHDHHDNHLTDHLLIRRVKEPLVITGSLPKASSGYGCRLGDHYDHCHCHH